MNYSQSTVYAYKNMLFVFFPKNMFFIIIIFIIMCVCILFVTLKIDNKNILKKKKKNPAGV